MSERPLHWAKRLRLQLSEFGQEIKLLQLELKAAQVQQRDAEAECERLRAEVEKAQSAGRICYAEWETWVFDHPEHANNDDRNLVAEMGISFPWLRDDAAAGGEEGR